MDHAADVLGGAVEAQDGLTSDRPRRQRAAAAVLVLAASLLLALDFLRAWETNVGPNAYLAFDTYNYFYRNMLYAAHAVAEGGRGLFWNSLQHCGQPFFSVGSTAVLYPPNWLFLWLAPDVALRTEIVFHLVVGGVGTYALCREIGTSRMAALAGTIAFELGNGTLNVTSWMPIVAAPYVWMPVALLYCERILRAPSVGSGIRLGLALAIALIAGFPQTVLFSCQLIGLRLLWELASRRLERPVAVIGVLALALLLPLLLDAVQLVPAIETTAAGLRGNNLDVADMAPKRYSLDASRLGTILGARRQINAPWVLAPAMIAAASLFAASTRRIASFYVVGAIAYFLLAFGQGTPLFALYLHLPLSTLFRAPVRFLWVTGFCLAVLTAFGFDALTPSAAARPKRPFAFAGIAAAASIVVVFQLTTSQGLYPTEWIIALMVIGAAAVAVLVPAARTWAAVVVGGALCLNLAWFHTPGSMYESLLRPVRPIILPRLLPDGSVMHAEAAAFAAVRERITPQDRVYLVYQAQTPPLAAKTGALFGLPSVGDYDPQPSRRMAEYSVMMRYGRTMQRVDEYYGFLGGTVPPTFRRRLLDLGAARYLVVAAKSEETINTLQPAPRRIAEEGNLIIYENSLALPRAFYVPRVEIVGDASELLRRLSEGSDDLRRAALVEEKPLSGFTGVQGNEAAGEVEIIRNDPEHVVLRVRAPERGFVHLADQYMEGWHATVGGEDVPITRANYLFRVVEVPAGESTIEMRYAPPGLRLGAGITLGTVLALLVYAVRSRTRRFSRAGLGSPLARA